MLPTSQASWLQFAFYFGYFCMALPAVFFIRKFSYKGAIVFGLALYAIGCLIAIPASLNLSFTLFVLGSYIIPCGLAFLETACNPYILSLGDPRTATQRLNLAQAFNPIGSLTGMAIATFILAPALETSKFADKLSADDPAATQYLFTAESDLPEGAKIETSQGGDKVINLGDGVEAPLYETRPVLANELAHHRDGFVAPALKGFAAKDPAKFEELQSKDLKSVRTVYLSLGAVILLFLIVFIVSKLPQLTEEKPDAPFGEITARIFGRSNFSMGVAAQAFNVGAQIMCWTYIVHYGIAEAGLTLKQAQLWNMGSMTLFLSSRFICTYLMRVINPSKLLAIFAIGGFIFTLGAIFLPAKLGLVSLVLVSGCMSLMFPTIYGIALGGMEQEEAKLGSAYLIMSIVGGAIGAKLQGQMITSFDVRTSFWLVTICFIVIAFYGFRTISNTREIKEAA